MDAKELAEVVASYLDSRDDIAEARVVSPDNVQVEGDEEYQGDYTVTLNTQGGQHFELAVSQP